MQAIAAGANEAELPEVEFPPINRKDVERIVKGGIRGGARETACTFIRWGKASHAAWRLLHSAPVIQRHCAL